MAGPDDIGPAIAALLADDNGWANWATHRGERRRDDVAFRSATPWHNPHESRIEMISIWTDLGQATQHWTLH
jgi:hypothetical protein